jgi:hypothetical protein
VQYFSKQGYGSRMINIWICLYKSLQPTLAPDELGLFLIENRFLENARLYQELIKQNIHVSGKSATTLVDNMHVGGAQVQCNLAGLRATTFPYEIGTMITFSSHLLHGSKGCDDAVKRSASRFGDCYRIALSSVWLHEQDLDLGMLEMPDTQYDSLYLWRHEKAMWPELKKYFSRYCEDEKQRITDIKGLIKLHREMRGNS